MADQFTDSERMDWLEREANEPGGILLHDGTERGRKGIGLRPGFVNRTLRQAIDSALHYERGSAELKASGKVEPTSGVAPAPKRPVIFCAGPHHEPCPECVKAGRCAMADGVEEPRG